MQKLDTNVIDEIFYRFWEKNPSPKIELLYDTPYQLLVAVILSAQSTDKGVNRVTPSLFEAAPTPYEMLELGLDGLKSYIKTIGLFNNKAKNIISMSRLLIEKYDNVVPDTMEELCKLPGVGRKSANVILNSIFGHKVMPVDTHVHRVSNRIGLCKTTNVSNTEKDLVATIDEKWMDNAHHWLVLHGRYVCKAKSPQCQTCIINDLCGHNSAQKYSL